MNIFKAKVFLLAVLLIVVAIFYQHITDGFSVWQITSSLSQHTSKYDVPYEEEDISKAKDILSQPFYYLGKGVQSYAFSSEDGKYVLKFFKQKHLRQFGWLNKVPMPLLLQIINENKIERHAKKADKLFFSYKLAYEKMREESGIILLHLNHGKELNKDVVIFDKLGFKHHIDINNYEFLIQKKGVTLKELIKTLKTPDEFLVYVNQIIDLLFLRYNKCIADMDYSSFLINIAFDVDGLRAIYIDTGKLCPDDSLICEDVRMQDLKARLDNLHDWTEINCPEFLSALEKVKQGNF